MLGSSGGRGGPGLHPSAALGPRGTEGCCLTADANWLWRTEKGNIGTGSP